MPEAPPFALQTYYALLVTLIARQSARGRVDDLLPNSPFSWHSSPLRTTGSTHCPTTPNTIRAYPSPQPALLADDDADLFRPLYRDLFPVRCGISLANTTRPAGSPATFSTRSATTAIPTTASRSGLWFSALPVAGPCAVVADEQRGRLSASLILLSLILFSAPHRRLRPEPAGRAHGPGELLVRHRRSAAGGGPGGNPRLPVRFDSRPCRSASCAATLAFDFVVGNPPWIAWDNLPDDDRQATKPLWERYGLFSLSGNEARHGGGKKDLSMLMLYAAADRYLKPGGRLGMVITQTLFQTKGAGDGFRRFRLGPNGPPLRVLRVDDLVALRPFDDAANWTSTIVLQKGAATEYPVPYFKWDEERPQAKQNPAVRSNFDTSTEHNGIAPVSSIHPSSFITHPLHRPVPSIPPARFALAGALRRTTTFPSPGKADYTARLGANSGGANGVYWVEVLDADLRRRTNPQYGRRGKHRVDPVEQTIEPDLVFRCCDGPTCDVFGPFPAAISSWPRLPANGPASTKTSCVGNIPARWRTCKRFRDLLTARAAYRRYQQRGPFYSMYNVGPYTVAPVKVVWRRMDRRINAAVVEAIGRPLVGPPAGDASRDVRVGGVRFGRRGPLPCARC